MVESLQILHILEVKLEDFMGNFMIINLTYNKIEQLFEIHKSENKPSSLPCIK